MVRSNDPILLLHVPVGEIPTAQRRRPHDLLRGRQMQPFKLAQHLLGLVRATERHVLYQISIQIISGQGGVASYQLRNFITHDIARVGDGYRHAE